ncbi:Conserved hypothetical protein [Candidatus Protochlamydia naegleriophila]|uniref:FAD-binding PCMH-type domain-containing protein n=2 Tax=Candidatus Protochlamydia naegleriophila TaxID=389348 RepID=A0A0U5JBP2_9BACT|nr:Conserved hypothetical protein [Candidatus Protochlamydia naegleriophila]
MLAIYEKPGAHTPWQSINQLLDSQERLEWRSETCISYLFAPKTLSKLSALLYLLKTEQVSYAVQNQEQGDIAEKGVWISVRSFSQAEWQGDGHIAVGAGSNLFQLQSKLLEEKYELGLEDLAGRHHSIASFLLEAPPMGLFLRQEALSERLLQVEWVNGDGGIVKWGRGLPGMGGPCLSQLIWGLRNLKAVLVKVLFKAYPIPPERLLLNWSFLKRDELWKQFDRLRSLTATWERLDLVIPNDPLQKGFLLAQISGSKEEMKTFSSLCPEFARAETSDRLCQLRKFFEQQRFQFQPIKCREETERKELAGYCWYHGLTDQSWFVHPFSHNDTIDEPAEWKKRFWNCLNN